MQHWVTTSCLFISRWCYFWKVLMKTFQNLLSHVTSGKKHKSLNGICFAVNCQRPCFEHKSFKSFLASNAWKLVRQGLQKLSVCKNYKHHKLWTFIIPADFQHNGAAEICNKTQRYRVTVNYIMFHNICFFSSFD